MSSYHAYPKIYNVGHRIVSEIFSSECTIEEKIDASQFSACKINGVLKCRSKNKELDMDNPEKMFIPIVDVFKSIMPLMINGYTYRGEYASKPKHNVLAYDRIPKNFFIGFDINTEEECYMSYEEKNKEFERLGFETVPLLLKGKVDNLETLLELLEKTSILGGQKIEGFVVKNYELFGPDKKVLMAKHVSEAFKEVHKRDFKKSNPTKADILVLLAESYKTKARWNKSIQHLKERGEYTQSPKDIGVLIQEVQQDVKDECKDEIMEKLFGWAWPNIKRKIVAGLPEWYKEELLKGQFEK